jgi:hypothetical protein
MERETMLLKCPRCEYVWDYGGECLVATCPACRISIYNLPTHIGTVEEYKKQLEQDFRDRCAQVDRDCWGDA